MFFSFKDIPNCEGKYQANKLGQIKSIERNKKSSSGGTQKVKEKLLVPSITTSGYLKVGLSLNSGYITKLVHRLVAETFIENLNNKPQVNHKNGVKTDNRVENLEWNTRSENMIYADLLGLRNMPKNENHHSYMIESDKHSRAKKVIDTETLEIYGSVKTLSELLGVKVGTLRGKLNGSENNNTKYLYLENY